MTVLSLNGLPRVHQLSVSDGGVPKFAVPQATITKRGVEGDRQRNPDIHGGPDRAVCVFSLEIIEALQAEGPSDCTRLDRRECDARGHRLVFGAVR
jgi:MOSC domain-containing protein YiiM